MRISDWSSDVCSSDLGERHPPPGTRYRRGFRTQDQPNLRAADDGVLGPRDRRLLGLSAGGEISMGDGTSIGRVRGLGAAKEGTHHWWHQRLTAGGNLLRAEARRVGNEGVRTCRSRGSTDPEKEKQVNTEQVGR